MTQHNLEGLAQRDIVNVQLFCPFETIKLINEHEKPLKPKFTFVLFEKTTAKILNAKNIRECTL